MAAESSVMPRIFVFLAHKTRPKPRISGSPPAAGAIVGTMTGAGEPSAFDFLRNNIPHSKRTALWHAFDHNLLWFCLLYTSDAADDLLCVDLGGRRIIKKKKK